VTVRYNPPLSLKKPLIIDNEEWRSVMVKVPPDKLMPGMRLAKPIMNKAGMALLGQGTELTETWIMRIQEMELEGAVHVEGKQEMEVPLDEMLAALEERFRTPEGNHRMERIKRAVERHIRNLYE
jgi:hypothetical protein